MKPDFSTMNRKELRAYLLAHRDDEAAFFAYVDRSNQEATWVDCPPVESVESLQTISPLFSEITARITILIGSGAGGSAI